MSEIKYITIKKFCEKTGYTVEAVKAKMKRGQWLKDEVWVKAPDGRILISVPDYYEWVEKGK